MNLSAKQILLEDILDALCQATDRQIFIMLPKKEEERIPYLKKEIITTLERVQ